MSTNDEPIPGSCIVVGENEDTDMCNGKKEDSEDYAEKNGNNTEGRLSKTQMKKQRAREKWLEKRAGKRHEEKERRKIKRKALREAGQGASLKRSKGKLMTESTSNIRVAIDMSFDHLMTVKDYRRTVQQVNFCYAANRKAEQPLQYYVVGFNGPSRAYYDSIETNKNQDIYTKEEPLDLVFSPPEIVYLTADSDNVLTSLDESKVYVIGGIVDHNAHKGLCFQLAEKKGYGHARLPIDEFVNMKTRKVLTVNHVFEILLHFSHSNDWEKAFFAIMPERKQMTQKEKEEEEERVVATVKKLCDNYREKLENQEESIEDSETTEEEQGAVPKRESFEEDSLEESVSPEEKNTRLNSSLMETNEGEKKEGGLIV